MFLTKRQSQLLDYLRKTIAVQGYAPSLEEMAHHFELSSVGTVHKHLKALEEKGYIRRQWNRSRAIEILDMPDGKARRIPLLGRLRAGGPIEAMTDSESIAVPEEFLGRAKAFVLLVDGSAMKHECIDDGDYLVVEQRDDPRDGETALVLVDNRVTHVGRVHRNGDSMLLHSREANGPTVRLEPGHCRVQGVLLGVLRRFEST